MSNDDDVVDQRHLDAIADAEQIAYWLDGADAPETNPTLVRTESCDLCVVGGGYTGLWTAIIAKERDRSRDVVLIEAHAVGGAASGRNGGFMDASLTHGISNALRHFPDEVEILEELGIRNLDEIEMSLTRYGIDSDYQRPGVIEGVSESHPASYRAELLEQFEMMQRNGHDVEWLDTDRMRDEVYSPTFTAGLWDKNGSAFVDPARLAWGLKAVAERLGVRIYEDTKATAIERDGIGVMVTTPLGKVRAGRVALATNAFKPLLKRISNYIAPVYDYCMITEPLDADQLASIGWANRQGLSDNANQFHYYRLTSDNRILWGGYDAVYYWGGKVSSELESRPESWAKLSANFFHTFPQLEGVQFSHMWGGAIDTSSRFTVFFGRALGGRVGYALGYTGLGVAASRFGAATMLDLLYGRRSIATQTSLVREKPWPFPPEPFRFIGIQATRWSLEREDRTGKRNLWLRGLDRVGLGFDS